MQVTARLYTWHISIVPLHQFDSAKMLLTLYLTLKIMEMDDFVMHHAGIIPLSNVASTKHDHHHTLIHDHSLARDKLVSEVGCHHKHDIQDTDSAL